jgi:hypothetical protein
MWLFGDGNPEPVRLIRSCYLRLTLWNSFQRSSEFRKATVAVEYDHLFMGSQNVTFPASNIAVSRADNIKQDVDMGTVRVNYRFGGPVVAKY